MPEPRVFVPSSLVDRWITAGAAELDVGILRARRRGVAFAIDEAVQVVAEVSGGGDAHGLVGRARLVSEIASLGGEILDRSLVVGDAAYDVVPGFLVAPAGQTGAAIPTTAVLAALAELSGPDAVVQSDEELLARYLIQKL